MTAIRKGITKKSKSSSSNAASTSDDDGSIVSNSSRATSPSGNNNTDVVIEPSEYIADSHSIHPSMETQTQISSMHLLSHPYLPIIVTTTVDKMQTTKCVYT